MANQISAGTLGGEYCVIDNGSAPAATALDFSKAPIGYDTTYQKIRGVVRSFWVEVSRYGLK